MVTRKGVAHEETFPSIAGAAYANNVPGGDNGATTLYDIDFVLDALVTQGMGAVSPNTGTLFTVGPLGVSTGSLVGFDISGSSGTAFASLTPAGSLGSGLYTINLATGAATLVGNIGGGNVSVQDISAVTVSVAEPESLSLLGLGLVSLALLPFPRRVLCT